MAYEDTNDVPWGYKVTKGSVLIGRLIKEAARRMEYKWTEVLFDQSLSVDEMSGYAQSGLDWLSVLNLMKAELEIDETIAENS